MPRLLREARRGREAAEAWNTAVRSLPFKLERLGSRSYRPQALPGAVVNEPTANREQRRWYIFESEGMHWAGGRGPAPATRQRRRTGVFRRALREPRLGKQRSRGKQALHRGPACGRDPRADEPPAISPGHKLAIIPSVVCACVTESALSGELDRRAAPHRPIGHDRWAAGWPWLKCDRDVTEMRAASEAN